MNASNMSRMWTTENSQFLPINSFYCGDAITVTSRVVHTQLQYLSERKIWFQRPRQLQTEDEPAVVLTNKQETSAETNTSRNTHSPYGCNQKAKHWKRRCSAKKRHASLMQKYNALLPGLWVVLMGSNLCNPDWMFGRFPPIKYKERCVNEMWIAED